MFTGIIEALGTIQKITTDQAQTGFFGSKVMISSQLKIDESLSHNGICLTVEEIQQDLYRVTAISETLNKTNAGKWEVSDVINLERSLQMNGRLDGHIVQGHVDGTAICIRKKIGAAALNLRSTSMKNTLP